MRRDFIQEGFSTLACLRKGREGIVDDRAPSSIGLGRAGSVGWFGLPLPRPLELGGEVIPEAVAVEGGIGPTAHVHQIFLLESAGQVSCDFKS